MCVSVVCEINRLEVYVMTDLNMSFLGSNVPLSYK